jgi:hypothetical protein
VILDAISRKRRQQMMEKNIVVQARALSQVSDIKRP